jgi:hypothetical protein
MMMKKEMSKMRHGTDDDIADVGPSPDSRARLEGPTPWQIVRNALDSLGSQVIYDSAKGRVEYCPNSSMCEGTPDHEPDCWIGQAMRLIPTCDTEEPKSDVDRATEVERERAVGRVTEFFNGLTSMQVNLEDLASAIREGKNSG